MKFDCPHCQQSIETGDESIGKELLCPSCQQPLSLPVPSKPAPVSAVEPTQQKQRENEAFRIRGQAYVLCVLAVLSLAAALLAAIVTVLTQSDTQPTNGLPFAGDCLWSAMALCLLGQIMHIRANTLK